MPKRSKTKLLLVTAIALAAAGGVTAGFYMNAQAEAGPAEAAAPPPATPVQISIVEPRPVRIWKEFSGRLEAVNYVRLRPQVSGTIKELKFEDGQIVNKGDVLLIIDPRPYKAAVDQAQAELMAAKNELELARKELQRAEGLIQTDAISRRIYDERQNTVRINEASVKSAAARLDSAKINLEYAYVKAPISGRLSRAEIKEGNLVEAGPNAPVLTSIVSTDGIYADFEVDEQTYLTYIRSDARDRDSEKTIPVKLTLSGDGIEYEGFIDSFDNQIDASSGTIRARAYFANKDGALLPGMYANIKVGSPEESEKILVSERAIGTDQDRKFVYVVGSDNKAAYREIRLGESIDGQRVVKAGLEAGDRVITEGIIRISPDMPVDPQLQAGNPQPEALAEDALIETNQ